MKSKKKIRNKKLNNKGFAISAIIYGLSIMSIMLIALIMATISSDRANNLEFSERVEKELVNYSQSEISFSKLDNSVHTQEYRVPENESGWYKIELWGAQGGGDSGGRGAYTSGIIRLEEGDKLHFYVGKHGAAGSSGEETDVRVDPGNYDDKYSYQSRIMVAAGGGAQYGAHTGDKELPAGPGGTVVGYRNDMRSFGGLYDDDFNLIPDTELDPFGHPNFTTRNGSLVGYLGYYNTENYGVDLNSYATCSIYGENCSYDNWKRTNGLGSYNSNYPVLSSHMIGAAYNNFNIPDRLFNDPFIHIEKGAGDGFVPNIKILLDAE